MVIRQFYKSNIILFEIYIFVKIDNFWKYEMHIILQKILFADFKISTNAII